MDATDLSGHTINKADLKRDLNALALPDFGR